MHALVEVALDERDCIDNCGELPGTLASPTSGGTKGKTGAGAGAGGGVGGAVGVSGMWPPGEKPPPKKKAKPTKAQQAAAAAAAASGADMGQESLRTGGVGAGAPGGVGGMGGMPGSAPAKGKSKPKAAANGRGAGATGQLGSSVGGVAGGLPGQMPGSAGSAQRLGYGPKVGGANAKQAAQAQAKNVGRGAAMPGGAMAARPGQPGMNAGMPPGQAKTGQAAGLPGSGQAGAAGAPGGAAGAPGQPVQGAPVRVRQAFKWAYNLRKKAIDKSRIRKSTPPLRLPTLPCICSLRLSSYVNANLGEHYVCLEPVSVCVRLAFSTQQVARDTDEQPQMARTGWRCLMGPCCVICRRQQYTVMLPSGLDVHTAMVVLDREVGSRQNRQHIAPESCAHCCALHFRIAAHCCALLVLLAFRAYACGTVVAC